MYAKIRKSMFEGTLAGTGETWAVFVFLLVQCDAQGFVDIHPKVISRLTGFDEPMVRKALAELEAADFSSRSEEAQGARIVRVDEHRDWGWHVTNYVKYRSDPDLQTVRQLGAARQKKFRDKHCNVTVTPRNAPSRQEEVEVDGEVEDRIKTHPLPPRSAAASLWDNLLRMELPDFLPREAWVDFVNHRRSLGAKGKLTERAARLTISELQGLNDSGHPPGPVISQSVTNNWKGVFPIKNGVPNVPAETKPKTKRWTCTVCGKTGFSDDGGPDFRSCPDCEARYARH